MRYYTGQLAKYGATQRLGRYERIADEGLHITLNGESGTITADTVVLCTGQESERGLDEALAARGVGTLRIGGAATAVEHDALRAIDEGMRLAQSL
ncbi:2,4-dienoyl-CoA reductase [Hyphomicrobium sp.]|uniref:2,4-dienoyl-CoA reductase n=1 Tax=Hyphomicrobium sp. TaxID=82 RepID=UPI002FDF595A